MNTQQTIDTASASLGGSIAEEAAQWIITFRRSTFSEDDPNRDAATRNASFVEWVRRSSAHLLLFMEMVEVERRFRRLDTTALACIREHLKQLRQEDDQAS